MLWFGERGSQVLDLFRQLTDKKFKFEVGEIKIFLIHDRELCHFEILKFMPRSGGNGHLCGIDRLYLPSHLNINSL